MRPRVKQSRPNRGKALLPCSQHTAVWHRFTRPHLTDPDAAAPQRCIAAGLFPLLPLLLLLLLLCRVSAIVASNVLVRLGAMPLTISTQKMAPMMAVREHMCIYVLLACRAAWVGWYSSAGGGGGRFGLAQQAATAATAFKTWPAGCGVPDSSWLATDCLLGSSVAEEVVAAALCVCVYKIYVLLLSPLSPLLSLCCSKCVRRRSCCRRSQARCPER